MQPEAAVPTAEIVFNTASAKTNSILTYTEAKHHATAPVHSCNSENH